MMMIVTSLLQSLISLTRRNISRCSVKHWRLKPLVNKVLTTCQANSWLVLPNVVPKNIMFVVLGACKKKIINYLFPKNRENERTRNFGGKKIRSDRLPVQPTILISNKEGIMAGLVGVPKCPDTFSGPKGCKFPSFLH
jgi:hypothetical protein